MPLVSGNINHLYMFEGVSCWSVVRLEWDRWNRRIFRISLPYLRKFNVGINYTLRRHTDLDNCRSDLEWPIQLKVRMSHGLLADSVDTSLASLLSYNRCGVQWSARSV